MIATVLSSLTGLATRADINTGTKVPSYYLAVPLGPHGALIKLPVCWKLTFAGVFHEMVGAILRMERSAGVSPADHWKSLPAAG